MRNEINTANYDFNITVNNQEIGARKGETILEVLRRNNINVPTLCHIKDMFPSGACRMCVVEVEGRRNLVTACSEPVAEGMKIQTHSQRVITSRKVIVELLLNNHPDDCLYCVRSGKCELQQLSGELNITDRRLNSVKKRYQMDVSSPSIIRDSAKCILCGRCVRVCEEIEGVAAIDFVGRGSKTVINTVYNRGLNVSSCINCGQCIMACPTGALTEKSHLPEVLDMLSKKEKTLIVQYAPSITVSLAEEFGLESGKELIGQLNAALRKIGFNAVFDTSFSADLTIIEEATELIGRIRNGGTLPMFTSCCPGWVKFTEEFYPEMIPNLSTCKSPQQMMGAVIKNIYAKESGLKKENIYVVSVMPCTAKKFEQQRDEMIFEGINDVDAVLTTRELAKLIRLHHLDLTRLNPELADSPLGMRSSAGKIFGASGGVMEAALRTAHFFLTGKELTAYRIPQLRGTAGIKTAHLEIDELKLGVAVVSGLANARKLLEDIKNGRDDIHFIEVMACPGGCVNGGGQPIGSDSASVMERMKSLYAIDDTDSIKASHLNPYIKELYAKHLGKPNGHLSHKILHTSYMEREVLK